MKQGKRVECYDARVFMMILRVYDDQRMTSWKEFILFYVRLQGGSVLFPVCIMFYYYQC